MRGIIFNVSTNEHSLGWMSASDFAESLTELNVDFVADRDTSSAYADLKKLMEALSAVGFDTVPEAILQERFDAEDTAFSLKTGEKESLVAAQCNYFQQKLHSLQKQVGSMNLTAFSTEPTTAAALIRDIDDRYGDVVYLDMGNGPATYTLDGFIRRLMPNSTYFFACNTVLMH